ncbi:MAG: radical SAM family heme chaperone HemW [Spirochaetales bacterium]|nr:radical SAM family heme chaperone HemW [Spirochaetales bacterium]
MDRNKGIFSLYIHIPFCRRKCSYCDFFSRTPTDASEIETLLSKIVEEFNAALKVYPVSDIPTIFIGGGTPSVIPPPLFDRFLNKIEERLPGKPVEWSCEVNPESLTPAHLDVFQKHGINRLSMGIQSFNSSTLETLGRYAKPKDVYRSLELIENRWKGSWNADLICEVPGQSRDDALKDIKNLTSWNPSHVSLYSLILEAGTPLSVQYKRDMDAGIEKGIDQTIWQDCSDLLEVGGWRRYEVSNFAKEDNICLHNMIYWEMKPFIGLGPSASSTMPNPMHGKNSNPLRHTNPLSIREYMSLDFIKLLVGEIPQYSEVISYTDFLSEFLMMGFRTKRGLDPFRFKKIFGLEFAHALPSWSAENIKQAMIEHKDDSWVMTDRGMMFLNTLILDAMMEIDEKNEVFRSKSINWP